MFIVRSAPLASDALTSEGLTDKGCTFWWAGLQLIPTRPQLGLLGAFSAVNAPTPPAPSPVLPTSTEDTQNSETNDTEGCSDVSDTSSCLSSSSSPNGEEEEEEHYRPATPKTKVRCTKSYIRKNRFESYTRSIEALICQYSSFWFSLKLIGMTTYTHMMCSGWHSINPSLLFSEGLE